MVLRLLLDHPTAAHYGLELSKRAGLATGTIYPILTRLEQAGWVVSGWEERDPGVVGRPRRRLYWLTQEGAEKATTALEEGAQALLPGQRPPAGLRRPGPSEAPA
jgi:PadR family transcriptional regulator, regulatory protein PadR